MAPKLTALGPSISRAALFDFPAHVRSTCSCNAHAQMDGVGKRITHACGKGQWKLLAALDYNFMIICS